MRISSNYNFLNIDSNKSVNKNRVNNILNKNPYSDAFVKSTPAFKGSLEEDLFNMILDKVFDMFNQAADSLITEIIQQTRRELEVATYIDALSDKSVRKILLSRKTEKLSNLNNNVFDGLGYDIDFINKLFEQANIKTVLGIDSFIRAYTREPETRKVFKGQEIEAVKIYGMLNSKDNLSKFSELLLYLYNQEENSKNPDYTKLNEITDFLRKVGVNNFKDFDEKFAFLKPRFNDFETTSDKVDAVEYLQRTYDSKISLLGDIIKQSDLPQNIDSEKVYASSTDIVEYFYEKNNGESLQGLEDIIDYVVYEGKIKSHSLRQIASSYNDFKNPEDKIDFFKFLKDCNVSIIEFNLLSGKPIISNIDNKSIISNKEILSQYIAQIKGVKESEGFDYYKNFKDVLNSLYDETENPEGIRSFIELADRFSLKNSDSVLQLYNRVSETKKKSITAEELRDFIELFEYSDSASLFADAKAQNISVVDLLKNEKQQFLSVKDDIDSFIYSDSAAFFAGQSSVDVYKKYRDLIIGNIDNVPLVLQNIVDFDIQNVTQYSQKALEVMPFTKFFEDKETMLKFFTDNNIKFGDSLEDILYRNNCIEIFNALYEADDKEKSFERINYIATSGFLVKSKNRLPELLEKMPSEEVKKDVLTIIADKKVPSIYALEKFFKQYATSNTKGVELLNYLRNLPEDVDFTQGIDVISSLQAKINDLNVPIQINGNNIDRIDVDSILAEDTVSTKTLIDILENISNSTQTSNFIVALPGSTNKTDCNAFSSYRIAQEIASKIDKSGESYQNISRLLGIDRVSLSLPNNCSYYFYVKAIENALPKEFVEFVNSDEWMKFSDDKVGSANLVLHARLRAIDRFALNDADNIDVLYQTETISKLKDLFRTIYTKSPIDIKGTDSSKRFVADFVHGSNVIEAVFLDNGEMITIVPKRNPSKA